MLNQFGLRHWQVAKVSAAGLSAILLFLVACPASTNCNQPAYQQCRHLQDDVEGMARAGDARYLGRSFGNKDIQCSTEADTDAAKEMIRSCAARGEWTSNIQVADAQDLLARINQPRLLPANPVNVTDLPGDGPPANDIVNEIPASSIEGAVAKAAVESESSPLPAIVSDNSSQTDAVAPPVTGDAIKAQNFSAQPEGATSNSSTVAATPPPTPAVAQSRDWSPLIWGLVIGWLAMVVGGIVAGWKQKIVVFRNYDDLAMMFFMMAIPLCIVWIGDYGAILAAAVFFGLLIWSSLRTWKDQSPRSIWAFFLAMTTKLSLGILFVNSLWSVISPGGKTQLARARARATGLGMLAILTPIVMRLVRDHVGVWSPRNVLSPYQRRRAGI